MRLNSEHPITTKNKQKPKISTKEVNESIEERRKLERTRSKAWG